MTLRPIPTTVETAHGDLVARIASLKPNVIRLQADAADFQNRRDHLRDIAAAVDAYILALGQDAKDHASAIDIGLFTNVVSGAVNGNATFDLEMAARNARHNQYDGTSPGPFYRARSSV